MRVKLVLRIIATTILPNAKEIVASETTLDRFAPDVLDKEIDSLLERARETLTRTSCTDPKQCGLEISMQLSSDVSGLRPALHLSRSVVEKLASVGASFNFDPYC
jgi:hypothetical protein